MECHQKKVILGAEWDQTVRARLFSVLKEMGAEPRDHHWGIGGSQEIDTLEVSVDDRCLVIEAETYVGLTLTGPIDLVERIQSRLASI